MSTYRSVAVHFDPLSIDVEKVRATLMRSADAPPAISEGKTVVIPVQYGGEMGPTWARLPHSRASARTRSYWTHRRALSGVHAWLLARLRVYGHG